MLTWHKYGKLEVGFDGDKVIAIVGREEESPVEMYSVQILQNCFISPDSAKADAEKAYEKFLGELNRPPADFNTVLVSGLKAMMAVIQPQSANAETSKPSDIPEKSANVKE